MKIISHRGNLYGPSLSTENHKDQIYEALSHGFDVEVDIWFKNGKYYTGHDYPKYLISNKFINDISPNAWFHCKNLDALYMFSTNFSKLNYFWHESDKFTLTSSGLIWTYPGQNVTNKSILVLLEKNKLKIDYSGIYGICTDYPFDFI